MARSCIRHSLQGAWGRAAPGYPLGVGEREGQSRLAKHTRGEREGRSPLASTQKHMLY
jgi:hypothetical protein